ncbi:MAG: histidine kinase [Gammaproteobacteria bacterium]|nr:histidine kinase [Gammaproteobacteria bacterium]
MSLRLRLSVILTFVLIATIAIGMTYLMLNARQAISEELKSSAELSSKMIALALAHVPPDNVDAMTNELADQLASVGDTRHLRISVTTDPRYSGVQAELPSPEDVPVWFVSLVHPEPLQLVRVIKLGVGPERIVLRADASDEIGESWREVRPLLLMLLAFGISAIVLVYIVLGRSLSSLNGVSSALKAVEEGEFDARVPRVGVPEIDIIAERFNHMSAVLMRSARETQLLAQRSLAIQEDERRRLAQELHDELGQSISAIKALAVSIRDRRPALDATVVGSADTIVDVSTDIYDRVRRMMASLRPVILDELGLVSALQNMVDDWNSHHEDAFVQFRIEGRIPELADEVAINCYRVVQEALTNIAKHARADQASVALRGNDGTDGETGVLEIRISDNGVGFDVEATPRGLGMVGIYERVEVMNGIVELQSEPSIGTQYVVTVPLGRVPVRDD